MSFEQLVQTYDVNKGSLICDGRMVTGFGEDQVIEAEKNHDNVIPHESVDGSVAFAINAKDSWTLKVTIKQTSPWIRGFHDLAKEKKPFPVEYIDKNDAGIDIGGNYGMVIKSPSLNVGNEIAEQEVEIFIANAEIG